jgi:hypothetical protein
MEKTVRRDSGLFKPAISMLGRLGFSSKLALLCLLAMLPAVFALVAIFSHIQVSIAAAVEVPIVAVSLFFIAAFAYYQRQSSLDLADKANQASESLAAGAQEILELRARC